MGNGTLTSTSGGTGRTRGGGLGGGTPKADIGKLLEFYMYCISVPNAVKGKIMVNRGMGVWLNGSMEAS